MSQCLVCSKSCVENTLFCDECRSALLNRLQHNEQSAVSLPREPSGNADQEQTVSLYTSTLPRSAVNQSRRADSLSRTPTVPDIAQEQNMSQLLQDARPESEGGDRYDTAPGDGPEQFDPLVGRRVPVPDHALSEPSEPVNRSTPPRRGLAAFATIRLPRRSSRLSARRRTVRNLLLVLAVLTVLAFIADMVLLSMNIARRTASTGGATLPMLTVSPNVAESGQVVRLHIAHFPVLTDIFVSHDVQETVRTDVGSALLQVGPTGVLDVSILIENSWSAGIHTIEAEDVTTHYTASAIVQVTGGGPVQPPRLALNRTTVNMGSGVQGLNSVQSVTLRNLGGGTLSWFASSDQADQSWLFVTPSQGVFSDNQSISVAVTRANLAPGTYHGILTLQSNAGTIAHILITMAVLPRSAAHEPVPGVTPPARSFMAVDSMNSNAGLNEQIVTIHNPSSQPLHWDTTSNPPTPLFTQSLSYIPDTDWLHTMPSEGTLAPGATTQVHVGVQTRFLLPGVYNMLLHLSYSQNATHSSVAAGSLSQLPQPVAVSLTVQPACGVVTSMGMMTFTMVAGQAGQMSGGSGTQSLGLAASPGCAGSINWQGSASASWLSLAPDHGQLQTGTNATAKVSVQAAQASALQPGIYTGFLVFVAGQRSQTVLVQLTVLASSSTGSQSNGQGTSGTTASATATGTSSGGSSGGQQPISPVLSISSSSLNFTATQGQGNPAAQSETMMNSGGSPLNWQVSFDAGTAFWLSIAPESGTLLAQQKTQFVASVNANGLATGTYSAQVTVSATDSSGAPTLHSPQFFTVTLTIGAPCALQISPNTLTFSVILLNPNPPDQSVLLSESGNCARPVAWSASVDANSSAWLSVKNSSGNDNGSGSSPVVHVNTQGMLIGKYTGSITIYATGNGNAPVQASPQTVTVTLTVVKL